MALFRTEFYKSDLVSIRYVRCRSASSGLSDVEYSAAPVLIMPVKGVFAGHFSRSQRVLAEPNSALVLPPDRAYKVSHPAGQEDDSLVFEYSQNIFNEALAASGCDNQEQLKTYSLLAPQTIASRSLLRKRLQMQFADGIEVEETAITLLSHVLHQPVEATENSRITEQIESAKLAIVSNPEERWTLQMLADHVESSMFHLTRFFHKKTGIRLHQYLLQTRIAKAIELLLDTDQDLITIAFALGFSSHSHFTAAFRRLVGMTPRDYRTSARTTN